MKRFKRLVVKALICVCFLLLIGLVYVPITAYADFAVTDHLTITFKDNYNSNQGRVEYSVNDGASWVSVTSAIENQAITMSGDNLRIRIVPNQGYRVDFTAISYREGNGSPLSLNDQSNSSIAGGLTGSNGYYASPYATSVALENVEFREGDDPNTGGVTGANFDGRATVVWSCGSGVCYHNFTVKDLAHCDFEHPDAACDPEIGNFDDGNSTFFKDTEIEADNKAGTKFNVKAQYRGWYLTDTFDNWVSDYKIATGNDVDWDTLDPEVIIGEPEQNVVQYEEGAIASGCEKPDGDAHWSLWNAFEACVNHYAATQGKIWTRKLQPVGEPSDNNAYVSYGDRNFKVVIYNSNFKGITTGDLTGLNYYPSRWTSPFLRTDQYDISGTSKNKPTGLNSILLEDTVNIDVLNYNNFEIDSIVPLDVPEDAVTVTKVNSKKFKLKFSSNFYDNVVFEVTDTNGDKSYFTVKRATIDATISMIDNHPYITADFYFDRTKNYTDFNITAKVVYKNGDIENYTLTAQNGVDNGLGDFTEGFEQDQEDPLLHDKGKGLKLSNFAKQLPDGSDRNISKIYMNVEYINDDNDESLYDGAYSGSGEGTLANIYQEEGE